jgi:hypothetical protein
MFEKQMKIDWGTWSTNTYAQEQRRKAKEAAFRARRNFLTGSGIGLLALTASTLGASVLTEFVPLELTSEEEEALFRLAKQHHASLLFGVAPDFDREGGINAISTTAGRAKEYIPETTFVGVFANTEDFLFPERMATMTEKLLAIHAAGFEPMLGLGPGAMSPHPLAVANDGWIKWHIDNWLQFLGSFDFPIHVRWMFEANIINGDISHRPTSALYGQEHSDRFKSISEYFDTERRKYPNIRYHLALASAGYDMRQYLADCAYDGIGIDTYPDIHGIRMVHHAVSSLLGWDYWTPFPHTMITDLAKAVRSYGTKGYIYEYSPLQNLDWMKWLLLSFYAHEGSSGDITFGINKSEAEGTNWRISDDAMLLRADMMKRVQRL